MIETTGLTKEFDGRVAVRDLDLRVKQGEIFAFLGPNGAGKTTTVRMFACLLAPTRGEARVGGFDVRREQDAIRARIGILTESPGLYETLSAQQNLEYFARLYGLSGPDRARAIKRYLDLLGLWNRRDEAVAGFSKGMKQKLAIARALLHEPAVLFLDEPTSGLDPESAKVVRDFIAALKQEGRTILLCTHNLEEADHLADRIGILKQHLIQVNTPENLRRSLYERRIVIRARNYSADHVQAVSALGFAKQIERRSNELLVSLDDPDAMTPAIVRALVLAGAELQAVTEEQHSLEQIYLKLVGSDGSNP